MATVVTDNGRQRIAVQASQASSGSGPTYSSARSIQVLAVDDNATGFGTTHTNLLSAGSITNEFDVVFDSTPTRSAQTTTHVATIPAGSGNFTHKRVSLHDDTTTNVTTSSTTLICGIDGQTIGKTADFSCTYTITLTYT